MILYDKNYNNHLKQYLFLIIFSTLDLRSLNVASLQISLSSSFSPIIIINAYYFHTRPKIEPINLQLIDSNHHQIDLSALPFGRDN